MTLVNGTWDRSVSAHMITQIHNVSDVVKHYAPSLYGGFSQRKAWQDLETFCLFLGYPRSGHSLVGALLNAHPNIAIAHESGALKYVYAGYSKHQIYDLILKKAKQSADPDRKLGGYHYSVPNQWQGRTSKLQVIGEKQGGGTALRLAASSRYLSRLRKILDIQLRFIHVVRNPYDNISTILQKTPRLESSLERNIEFYFNLCKTISEYKKTLSPDEIFEFKHEDFIKEPHTYLRKACSFLGVASTESYLADCTKIVYESPHKSRHSIEWPEELVDSVAAQVQSFSFLQGYAFDR